MLPDLINNHESDEREDFENQYKDIAEHYAKQIYDNYYPKVFVRLLPPKAKILDLGCGAGHDANFFANAGADVLGIDISKELIEEAGKRYPNLNLEVGDFLELDFGISQFDAVWCAVVFHHIPSWLNNSFIGKIKTLLKPNGLLFLSTMVDSKEVDQWMDTEWETAKGKIITKNYLKTITPKNMEELLKKHGFSILHTDLSDSGSTIFMITQSKK